MPGPLPEETKQRRNAPTIPTTSLPLAGRKGRVPEIPKWTELGKEGKAWWLWAWHTPQAAAWGDGVGMESMVARRASLEDDLAALARVESLDFEELLGAAFSEMATSALKFIIQGLARLATGRLAILREMRELDDRLGLTPKGMAQLRWKIVGEAPKQAAGKGSAKVTAINDRRDRLSSAS